MMVGRTVTVKTDMSCDINVKIMDSILVPLEVEKNDGYDFDRDNTTIVSVTRYLVYSENRDIIFTIDPQDITKFI